MRLNLETKTKEQELVKAYLEENASATRLLKRTERLLSTKRRWTAL